MSIISVTKVSKCFKDIQVLHDITLEVNKGDIFGLLGPSGAGKTTLIKLLLGLISNTKGEIKVLGKTPFDYDSKIYSSFGMVLDHDGFYERLSCYDNLEIFANIYSIKHKKKSISELLDKVGLSDAKNKSVSKLSKGMRQRLSFARAILHNPTIIFLDEPTSGLDPTTTLQIHSLIKEMQKNGTTFLLTTHNMDEAEKMCNRLALLNEGHIIEIGSPKEICMKHQVEYNVSIELENGNAIQIDMTKLNKKIIEIMNNNHKIVKIHSNEPTLEDVFIKLTGRRIE